MAGAIVITGRLDKRRLDAALAKMEGQLPGIGGDAVALIAERAMREGLAEWPKDTNRSHNGWAEAGNQTGLGPYPILPLKPSRYLAKIARALQRRLRRAQSLLTLRERQANDRGVSPDRWPSYRRAKRDVATAQEQIKRLEKSRGVVIALNMWGSDSKQDREVSIRHKVYGGSGAIVRRNDRQVFVWTNHEPHARFVENRRRIMATAVARVVVSASTKGGLRRLYRERLNAAKRAS